MHLPNIDLAKLVAAVGGDPWEVNDTIQSGSPAEISDLPLAFHNAGLCTRESDNAFFEALHRFQRSWNHKNGQHPINDSAEVQRVQTSLGMLAEQLPRIAVDLESIAAALSEAQHTGGMLISTLDAQLEDLDRQIGDAEDELHSGHATPRRQDELEGKITGWEHQAVHDTKSTLDQIVSVRDGYSDYLHKSQETLKTEGYDPAAINDVDAYAPPTPPESPADELTDIRQVTSQAVLDQMAKVRDAQAALDAATHTIDTHHPDSPEAQAATKDLPRLKDDLARALADLGNIPDYSKVDPATVTTGPDGHFLFNYNVNGQPVQVYGQLRNGTGEFFDQATGTYYTFQNGKLVGTRTLDPGEVEATAEPLWSAVTLAVGGAEIKAGGVALWQGLKSLFGREALEAGSGLTAENVLARGVSAAEQRAAVAEQNLQHLPAHAPLPGAGGLPNALTHAGPAIGVHAAPTIAEDILVNHGPGGVEHAPPGPHLFGSPDAPPPIPGEPVRPEFTLDNPLNHMPPELLGLSEQHLTGSGETVLGPFKPPNGGPSYIEVADGRNASYFDIGDAWNSYTPAEQMAANQHVLDIAIANRDKITLSVPFGKVDLNSFTAAEIRYLEAHGYHRVGNNILMPPTRGAPR